MLEFLQMLHWGAVLQIIMIDILLGGDNAVVIALACRNLEQKQRMRGILWGTAGAIFLRVVLIAFALTLLNIPFLKLVGGLLLIWIGVKLLVPETEGHGNIASGTTVWNAIKTIIIADFVMSLDNVIAIAAAANNTHADHQIYYVIFGLVVSVPIIIWGSTLVLRLIDRFPVVVMLGAGLLGWIAGGMLINDPVVVGQLAHVANGAWVEPAPAGGPASAIGSVKLISEVVGALLVVLIGRSIAKKKGIVKG